MSSDGRAVEDDGRAAGDGGNGLMRTKSGIEYYYVPVGVEPPSGVNLLLHVQALTCMCGSVVENATFVARATDEYEMQDGVLCRKYYYVENPLPCRHGGGEFMWAPAIQGARGGEA